MQLNQAAVFAFAFISDCDFTGSNLYGVSFAGATLTPLFPMRFPARAFPAPSSFSDDTTCPDGFTYETDINNGKTMEQMMTAENPPTQWKPVGVPGDWHRS